MAVKSEGITVAPPRPPADGPGPGFIDVAIGVARPDRASAAPPAPTSLTFEPTAPVEDAAGSRTTVAGPTSGRRASVDAEADAPSIGPEGVETPPTPVVDVAVDAAAEPSATLMRRPPSPASARLDDVAASVPDIVGPVPNEDRSGTDVLGIETTVGDDGA